LPVRGRPRHCPMRRAEQAVSSNASRSSASPPYLLSGNGVWSLVEKQAPRRCCERFAEEAAGAQDPAPDERYRAGVDPSRLLSLRAAMALSAPFSLLRSTIRRVLGFCRSMGRDALVGTPTASNTRFCQRIGGLRPFSATQPSRWERLFLPQTRPLKRPNNQAPRVLKRSSPRGIAATDEVGIRYK
jgi:hypothetical protein